MATRKFKQTNTPTPKSASVGSARAEVVRADAPGRAGRRGRAAQRSPGDAARGGAPGRRLASAALPRSGPKLLSRAATAWIRGRVYLYIYSLALAPSHPPPPSRQHSPLPAHKRPHPRPRSPWGGKRCLSGFGAGGEATGGDGGKRGGD